MKNNIPAFLLGLILTTVMLFGIVWYATRGETSAQLKPQQVINAGDLKKVKDDSADLKNYGNLPVVISPDDFGRSNPFESY